MVLKELFFSVLADRRPFNHQILCRKTRKLMYLTDSL